MDKDKEGILSTATSAVVDTGAVVVDTAKAGFEGAKDLADKQRPITAGKPQPFRSLSVQNVQLMAKDEDFGFQSFMRTKAVPHISEQKSEEGRHPFRS